MLTIIRKSTPAKVLSLLIILAIMSDLIYPVTLLALGGGPGQPEVESFQPGDNTEMVDLFTGDFSYNIPLVYVGGYPINLSYSSGITADQEASWTGLGWNLNPGVINRSVRGLPDDFKGDGIKKEYYIKPNATYGVTTGPEFELFGIEGVGTIGGSANLDINYNTYRGMGIQRSTNISFSAPLKGSKSTFTTSLGFSSGTNGVSVNPNLSFAWKVKESEERDISFGVNTGLSFNNRAGLQAVSLGGSLTVVNRLDEKNRRYTSSFGPAYSFARPTYLPQIEMPTNNLSISLRGTLGADIMGANPSFAINGYYSHETLDRTDETVPSYGYMYLGADEEALNTNKALMDLNRENDRGFNENTPALALTNLTYDIYSVSGQGIGGSYRMHRGSFGIVSDREVTSSFRDLELPEIEVGGGNLFKVGTNFNMTTPRSRSGEWASGNGLKDFYSFRRPENAPPDYENVYFKRAGDMSHDPELELYGNIRQDAPVRFRIDKNGKVFPVLFSGYEGIRIPADNYRKKRAVRNELMSYLTAEEASEFAVETSIKNHVPNSFRYVYDNTSGAWHFSSVNQERRITSNRKSSHISEMTVTRTDGTRYVYGIPAYNNRQEDATFAINGQVSGGTSHSTETVKGVKTFNPGTDDRIENGNGIDEYFNKETTPAYAHSYLLTNIFSDDYTDIDNNGPTPNDPGTYVKFNYSKIDNYRWRAPYFPNEAYYNEGLRSYDNDDKGSYIRGEKELWYLHSIETKTHIAVFYTSDRNDSRDETRNTSMKKLDRIVLYDINDFINSNKNNSQPVPLKTVWFTYDYSLCKNIPNRNYSTPQDRGKLTLKKLYFTYGNSQKGEMNTYRFAYGEIRRPDGSEYSNSPVVNPDYDIKSYDRWGNYQNNDPVRPNAAFPYTNQNYTSRGLLEDQIPIADYNAVAWNLTSIGLPEGGRLKIDYEADDYAYVQDRKAMQMFTVKRMKKTSGNEQSSVNLFTGSGLGASDYFNTVVVDIPQQYISQDLTIDDLLRDENGNVMRHLYFKFLVDVGKRQRNYEFVHGYSEIDFDNSSVDLAAREAYIALKPVQSNDNISIQMSPIVQAAVNFTIIYMPRIAYEQPDPSNMAVGNVLRFLASSATSIIQFIGGTYRTIVASGKSKSFDPGNSCIRLYNPVGDKKGGGSRVKRIRMSDEWNSFTGVESTSEYGLEYDYTMQEGSRTISSGVASYEPAIGGDENVFRQPVAFSERNLCAPNRDFYLEEPYGESFFPGAGVGYRKVTVTNYLENADAQGKNGRTVHEFYTAYDFPTFTSHTRLDTERKKFTRIQSKILAFADDFLTASQGFVVETNDMHGKHKSTLNYDNENIVSGTRTHYRHDPGTKRLLNNADVITPKNEVLRNRTIGLEYDFTVDMREHSTFSKGWGVNANLDAFLALILPITIPVILPTISREETGFKSVVTTKVINRFGLVEKVESFYNEATVTTENLAYDSETGQVILTRTINEFEDKYYSFNYPSHWIYDGMGQAYKNTGFTASLNVSNGVFNNSGSYFVHGDELMAGSSKYWVYFDGSDYRLIDREGNIPPDGTYDVKVLRPGRKNIQNISVGTVISKSDPIANNTVEFTDASAVISAAATELGGSALMDCNCYDIEPLFDAVNPFVMGIENNWRTYRDYAYLTQRRISENLKAENYNTNIRYDGSYNSYSPFWKYVNGRWVAAQDDRWIWSNEVTAYSNNGLELENSDPLGIYSSATYGYNNTSMISRTNNARYSYTGFDGFEDTTLNCNDNHFSFKFFLNSGNTDAEIVNTESHTGKRAIRIKPGKAVNMVKHIKECP